MNINSGKRVDVALKGYSGPAGFVERDGGAQLSFPSQTLRLAAGAVIDADERRWTVESVTSSPFVRGFKVVDLRPAEA